LWLNGESDYGRINRNFKKDKLILSIIIATWNTKELTLNCLKSIYDSEDKKILKDDLEVIVIDNNSQDKTSVDIPHNFPVVTLIKNEKNFGYAKAVNQGIKKAKGKFILLLGSDTEIKDHSLVKCIEFLESNENTGAVSCKLIFPDGRLQGNCKKFPTMKNAFFTYLSLGFLNKNYDMAEFKYDEIRKVDQIATTFLMCRSDLLKKLNGFDESYRIMYNDVDLCKRIYDEGYKIYFIPDCEVIHHGSFSTKKAGAKVRRIMYEDVYRYYKKKFGAKAILLLPVLFFRFIIVNLFRKNVSDR
jgi:GT2 family glycosyltransferase